MNRTVFRLPHTQWPCFFCLTPVQWLLRAALAVVLWAPVQAVDAAETNSTLLICPQSFVAGTVWQNPANAYLADGQDAVAKKSGDTAVYGTFSFGIPSDATIVGIEAVARWAGGNPTHQATLGIELSWDGGQSYTLQYSASVTDTAYTNTVFGGAQDAWGRREGWSSGELSTNNFRVRLNGIEARSANVCVDGVAVRVYYTGNEPGLDNDAGATNVTATSACLQGRISRGIPPPDIKIYWGPNDGTTNVPSWSNSLMMGVWDVGEFSTNLCGLVANGTNYYRCLASNAFGATWAESSAQFATRPPAVSLLTPSCAISEGGVIQVVTVAVDAASAVAVSVNYSTVADTAVAGSDYTATNGVLTWLANETGSKTISVQIKEDLVGELDESFSVVLSDAVDCVPVTSQATIAILDNDGTPKIRFSSPESSGVESVVSVLLPLTVSPAPSSDLTVQYQATGGSASNGVDYLLVSGVATVMAGQVSAAISLTVSNDSLTEADETIVVEITDPTDAVLGIYTSHTYTVVNDDQNPPSIHNNVGAADISATHAALRGEVTFAGIANPEVIVYWGVNNGEQSCTAWSNSIPMGTLGVGTFSTNVSGLQSNTLYYYRCFASNTDGAVWAPYTERFVAENPPQFNLLANEGFEIPAQKNKPADNWTCSGSVARVANNPKSGTYAMEFSASEGSIQGFGNNAFRISWNGLYAGGGANVNGGVRPGFVLGGTAYVKSLSSDNAPATFTNRWRNIDAQTDWMASGLTTNSIDWEPVAIVNPAPVPVAHVGTVCRPELNRYGGTGTYNADDVTVIAYAPRMELSTLPSNTLLFGETAIGSASSTNLGVKAAGGAPGTVLYGAYLSDSSQITNAAWSNTGWFEYSDPDNAFSIVSNAAVVATNSDGYQFATIEFRPTAAGSYTGIVRIATTDPVNRYNTGGVLPGTITIVYEEYTLVGVGTDPAFLALTTNELSFSATLGSTPGTQTFGVTNTGGTTLVYTNEVAHGTAWGWMTVSPAHQSLDEHAAQVQTVTVAQATQTGTFAATNTLCGNQANGPRTVVVTYHVAVIDEVADIQITPDENTPWSKLDLSWTRNAALNDVMILRSVDPLFMSPTPNTPYFAGYEMADGDEVVYVGSGTQCADEGLSPGTTYYYKTFCVNGGYYSTGVTQAADTEVASGLVLTTNALSFSAVLGSTPAWQTFGVTNTGGITLNYTNETTYGTEWAWMTFTPSNRSLVANATEVHTVSVAQATQVGGFAATNTLCGNQANGPQTVVVTYTVAPIENPTGVQVTRNGTRPWARLDLAWTRNAASNDVMIFRRQDDLFSAPTPNAHYVEGEMTENGEKVIYIGNDTHCSDDGLSPRRTYYYRFFSVNSGYYSAGVTAGMTTADLASGSVFRMY